MRWLMWTPISLFTIYVAVLGFRFGWLAATLDEGEVIAHYAERYVATMQADFKNSDAQASHCYGLPSDDDGVWMTVVCGLNGCGPSYREYHVNRIGAFVHGGDTSCPEAALQKRAT